MLARECKQVLLDIFNVTKKELWQVDESAQLRYICFCATESMLFQIELLDAKEMKPIFDSPIFC